MPLKQNWNSEIQGMQSAKPLPQSNSTFTALSNIDFLAHAFSGCGQDETPWVTGFPGDVASASHSVWFGRSALPMPSFIHPDNNNYLCVSTFRRGTDAQYRRRKNCWAGMWLVLLDDLGTKIPFDMLRLQPSCIVETSPGNYQAWLFLTSPERNQQRAESLINGLIAAGASDPGAGNVTRYGRLPTGTNGKAKYADKSGKPFTQRVHVWQPERRYSTEEIAGAYSVNLGIAAPRIQRLQSARTAPVPKTDSHTSVLEWAGLYQDELRGLEGGHRITCPWWECHTDQDTTGTVYFEPSEENDGHGGFKCHHGHCNDRNIADLNNFIAGLLHLRNEKSKVAA